MAKQFPLEVLLRLVDQVTPGLAKANGAISRFGKSASQIGRTISTHLGIPLTAFGVLSARTAATAEERFQRLFAFNDLSDKGRASVRSIISEVSRAKGFIASDLIGPAQTLLLEGVGGNLRAVLESVSDLARLEDIPVAESVDLMANAADRLGMNISDGGVILDYLFGAKRATSTNPQDIVDALTPVQSLLKTMRLPPSESIAVLGALIDRGLDPSIAGRGLFGILKEMSGTGFKSIADLVDSIAETLDSGDAAKGLSTFQQLLAVGADEGDAARIAFGGTSRSLRELFSTFGRATPAMLELIGIGSGRLREIAGEVSGSQLTTAFSGLPESIHRVATAWNELQTKFGSSDAVKTIVDKMGELIGFVDKLDPKTLNLSVSVLAVATAAGVLLSKLDLLLKHPLVFLFFGSAYAGYKLTEFASEKGWIDEIQKKMEEFGTSRYGASSSNVSVKFENAPLGMRIDADEGVEFEVGYAMPEAGR